MKEKFDAGYKHKRANRDRDINFKKGRIDRNLILFNDVQSIKEEIITRFRD